MISGCNSSTSYRERKLKLVTVIQENPDLETQVFAFLDEDAHKEDVIKAGKQLECNAGK